MPNTLVKKSFTWVCAAKPK